MSARAAVACALALAAAGAAGAAEVAALVGGAAVPLAAVDARCGAKCAALAAEAAARKRAMLETLVAEAVLARHPAPAPPAVGDDEVRAFIVARAAEFTGPPARDRAAVRFHLERERRRETEAAHVARVLAERPPVRHAAPDGRRLAPATVVAEVDGRRITDGDLERRLALPLYRLRGELARERGRWLEELVVETLWAEEARAAGLAPDALRARVRATAPAVSEADVDRHFEREIRARDPAAEKRPERIRPYLEFVAAQAAEDAFLAAARARRGVTVALREPAPPRLPLDAGAAGWDGPPDAPVRVVFLTGHRGARSGLAWTAIRALAAEADVAVAVRPLLPAWDPEAADVAAALRCAAAAGRRTALRETLALATPPPRAELVALAARAGLDPAAFERCVGDPGTAAAVAAESAEAERLGIDEAPAVLVNGRVLGGVQNPRRLRALVRRARRDAAAHQAAGGRAAR